jgi:hypothetical protein
MAADPSVVRTLARLLVASERQSSRLAGDEPERRLSVEEVPLNDLAEDAPLQVLGCGDQVDLFAEPVAFGVGEHEVMCAACAMKEIRNDTAVLDDPEEVERFGRQLDSDLAERVFDSELEYERLRTDDSLSAEERFEAIKRHFEGG